MPDDLPAPLSPKGLDMRGWECLMLDVPRLLASDIWVLSTPEEFKAAVALWCRAWQSVPCGSIPNDDKELAAFAGVNRKRWPKVRKMALRGFVLCSDGRLYHPVVCDDARKASRKKLEADNDAERKRKEREDRALLFVAIREAGRPPPPWNTSTTELRAIVHGLTSEIVRDLSLDLSPTCHVTGHATCHGVPSSSTSSLKREEEERARAVSSHDSEPAGERKTPREGDRRRAIVAELEASAMESRTPKAVDEWVGFLAGPCRCKSSAEEVGALRWLREKAIAQGSPIRFPTQAILHVKELREAMDAAERRRNPPPPEPPAPPRKIIGAADLSKRLQSLKGEPKP